MQDVREWKDTSCATNYSVDHAIATALGISETTSFTIAPRARAASVARMTRFMLITACLFAFAAGCKKKEENKGTQSGTTAAAPGGNSATVGGSAAPTGAAAGEGTPGNPEAPEGAGSAAAPAGAATPAKAEYKPDEIFKDTAGQDRMALMEKFKDGATVTGTVKEVKDDPAGEYVLVFDAGDGKTVEANLADPKPARDKKVKAGDTVTVTKCQVANPTDKSLPLRTCDLK